MVSMATNVMRNFKKNYVTIYNARMKQNKQTPTSNLNPTKQLIGKTF